LPKITGLAEDCRALLEERGSFMKDDNHANSPKPSSGPVHWISIKEASALTQKPERTLRYQLAQGRLSGKKNGQSWMIDFNSLAANNSIAVLPVREDITPPPPRLVATNSKNKPISAFSSEKFATSFRAFSRTSDSPA
jgi:hypothetical protein